MKHISDIALDESTLMSTKPKKENDRYYVFLSHAKLEGNVSMKVEFQTPKLKSKCDLMYVSSNVESEPTLRNFLEITTQDNDYIDKIKEIDDTLLRYVKSNKDEWFVGKNISDQFLELGQIGSIRENKETKGEHTMLMRTSKEMVVYDVTKTKQKWETITTDSIINVILQLSGVWFTATRWGASWKILQIKKNKTKEPIRKYLFDEDYDTDDDMLPPPGV